MTQTEDRGFLPDEEPIGTTLNRVCVGCGTDYEWTSSEGWQWPTSYCTRKCKRKSALNRLVKLDDDQHSDDMRLLICARCEEPFGWVPRPEAEGHLKPPLYCSRACSRARQEKQRKKRRAQEDAAKAERRAAHEAAVAAKQLRLAERAAREGRVEEAAQLRREIDLRHRAAVHQQWLDEKRRQAEEPARRAAEERAAEIVALSEAARELLLTGGRCASCGKVACPSQEDAKRMKREIEARAGRTNAVRYYECPDGWWHWTRMGADLDTWRAAQLMTESPASLRHRGRGGWTQVPQ